MRAILSILFLVISVLTVQSQNSTDSLLRLLDLAKTDTAKVNLLNKIANEYTRSDLGKSFQFSSTADSISSKIGYTLGKAESLRIQGVYFMRKSDLTNSLRVLKNSLVLFKQTGNIEGEANCLLSIGVTVNQMNKLDSALHYYQESLELWLKQKNINKERLAATYNNIGVIYRTQGSIPMALEYYQKSLKLKEEINDKAGASDTYNNLGVLYRMQKDYASAIYNYKKSLAIRKEIDYKRGIAMNYNNISIAYSEINESDSAIKYAKESLNINKELDNNRGVAFSHNALGDIYFKMNKLHESLRHYEEGIQYANEVKNNSIKAFCIIGIGEVMLKQHNYPMAYTYGKQAFSLTHDVDDFTIKQLSSKLLAEASANIGKYKEAYEFHKIYKTISDSILNESSTKKIIGLEYEYKYQKDKVEQEKKHVEQQAKLSRQKQITLAFLIGFLLVLALVLLVFSNLKRKQKDYRIIAAQKDEIEQRNKLLNSQKEEIQTQNELLVKQAKMLSELDEMKSRFFANISHELKTPLTLIVSPLSQILETNRYERGTFEVMHRNATKLQDMIEELLQIARMEKGAVDLQLEESNINELVKGVVHSFENITLEKGLTVETKGLENECRFNFDSAGMEKVISNLLSNAIKFTPNGKRIKVESGFEENHYKITVSDEGIGIPENEKQKIFNRFYRASNSQRVTGTGIGLSLVSDIVTLHGGTVNVGNSELGGAEFTVKIPLHRNNNLLNEPTLENTDANIEGKDKLVSEKTASKQTLLIIEDNKDLREFLVSSLNETYSILEAENGKIGFEVASLEPVDIIISDVMMPEMDGYTLTKTIRSKAELCHIPIVLLTAKSSEQSLIMGLEHEADAYITKPFSLNYLKAVLANQLNIRNKLHSKFRKQISVNPSEITTTSMDEQFIANATRVVEENISNEMFSVDDFCNTLLMSRTSVHRKITAITGLSTSDFIRTIRLKRAAQLIKGNTASISEISFSVGFSDVSYFTKCFKKEFGVTPTEYQ